MRNFRLGILVATLLAGLMGLGARSATQGNPDLSTPQKSYEVFVDILQSGDVDALPEVATTTGQVSLVALYKQEEYKEGMKVLGQELSNIEPHWDEITEDIYFATAVTGDRVHKMEFTKEEPGWMLYHWQIGGGADRHGVEQATEPED